MIICTLCKRSLPASAMIKSARRPGGIGVYCKECSSKTASKWGRENRERRDLNNRRAALAKYGLTLAAYDEMMRQQNDVCAICRKACKTGQRLSVDHDHATGRVRGLLCRRCNAGIGHLDTRDLLDSAIIYLDQVD